MTGIKRQPQKTSSPGPDGGDGFVLVSMALVVAAIVVGLKVQMGLSLTLAGLVGLSLFLGLAGFQAWKRSLVERDALSGELIRLEAELARLSRAPARPSRAPAAVAEAMPPIADPEPMAATVPAAMQPVSRSSVTRTTDLGALRPAEPLLPVPPAPVVERVQDVPIIDADDPDALTLAPSSVSEDDVEMLQRRIKEMLYQVTAAEQARDPATADLAAEGPSAAAAIETSLGALRATAQTMRAPSRPDATAVDVAPQSEPAEEIAIPEDPQVARVREALEAGRVDVFLEPILGLGDQAAQHYEVSIRLRGPACEDLGSGEDSAAMSGQGLLALFDGARLQRSAIVAERLAGRGKTGSVFSRTSGEALIAPDFARTAADDFGRRPATARQLVLTFSQADIRGFRAAEQRAVGVLSALGFRFAIAGLTDLDMNFEAMAKAGFGYVKLDASVLTEGLPHPGGAIPSSDVCRYLAEHGFSLIVDGIDSEETLARVFGFGAVLGQGALFGGRRPVRADVVARPGQAAA